MVGYVLAVVFKWTPGMEGYLRAMSVPIWTVLIFYLGKSGMGCLMSNDVMTKMYKLDDTV